MKISKEGNSWTAIGENKVNEEKVFGGFRYTVLGNTSKTLEAAIQSRVNSVQGIYEVLASSKYDNYEKMQLKEIDYQYAKENKKLKEQIEEEKEEIFARIKLYKEIAKNFNGLMKVLLLDVYDKNGRSYDKKYTLKMILLSRRGIPKKDRSGYIYLSSMEIPQMIKDAKIEDTEIEKIAQEMVVVGLTNKLRREYSKDGIKIDMQEMVQELLCVICENKVEHYIKKYLDGGSQSGDKKKIQLFLQELKKNYEKVSCHTAESIKKQDVKVQSRKMENGEYLLQLSNANHEKKKYLFEFMKEYANASAIRLRGGNKECKC